MPTPSPSLSEQLPPLSALDPDGARAAPLSDMGPASAVPRPAPHPRARLVFFGVIATGILVLVLTVLMVMHLLAPHAAPVTSQVTRTRTQPAAPTAVPIAGNPVTPPPPATTPSSAPVLSLPVAAAPVSLPAAAPASATPPATAASSAPVLSLPLAPATSPSTTPSSVPVLSPPLAAAPASPPAATSAPTAPVPAPAPVTLGPTPHITSPAAAAPSPAAPPLTTAPPSGLWQHLLRRVRDLATSTAAGFVHLDHRLDHQQDEIDALRALLHHQTPIARRTATVTRKPNWVRVLAGNPAHEVAVIAPPVANHPASPATRPWPAPAATVALPPPPIVAAPRPPRCTVSAVVPGRVWLRRADGTYVTYGVGDSLPDGARVTRIAEDGAVFTAGGPWTCRG